MDKFYTRGHVVEMCMNNLRESVSISRDDVIIEPSAGAGVFIPFLRAMTDHLFCYDTHPDHPDVEAMDFLEYTPEQRRRIHVVGNPPFGRQSAMAIRFIRHAAGFAATIAFILPRSFRKPSMHARIPDTFHLVSEIMLPPDSFTIDDKPHHVPCVFQVWVRTDGPRREVPPPEQPRGFRFVRKTEDPHIAIRRVGFYAGRISREAHDKSEQSHYFVRFNPGHPIIDRFRCPPGRDDTVGPRSLSKAEVIAAINEAIDKT